MNTINYWNYPTEIYSGSGAIAELLPFCQLQGYQHILIVTDQGITKLGHVSSLYAALVAAGKVVTVFDQVESNPSTDNVALGVKTYAEHPQDVIIALGGGSVLDAAKAISLVAADPNGLENFDWNVAFHRYPTLSSFPKLAITPLIMVPTTAGTGSELSREAVITNAVDHVKHVITHQGLLAKAVFLDPDLTVALPAHLTAATGVDALTHHLEAYFSPLNHPMSSGIALEGIRLIAQHLPLAVAEPTNLVARENMLVASAMAAVAFQKGLGGVHALAHALGGRYKKHHGLLNAILLPYVLKANAATIADKVAPVNAVLGLSGSTLDHLLDWVLTFRQQLSIPHSLAEIGIESVEGALIGQHAAADTSSADTNPIAFTAEEYEAIFLHAVAGVLV
ncbi:iron-containing alcohol dehydrogenase [Leeia sp. TBRC 13508]|uniref:Iron-containing alcohol dehydrogenase n=1 Tax=Leeia speluncae TaxID=2884804 RepID=A0ABS8D8B2_9NEIS|nr:iron-containing alcohol dehydrogenase [Leeia speluncae]MCB6184448.1 iron-containing alcohol dehydrogenase [Leeia speluncae]